MDVTHSEKAAEETADASAVVAVEDAQPGLAPAVSSTSNASNIYAVGVHVVKMAPAWVLALSVSFIAFILLLSWVRPDVSASGKNSYALNDSRVMTVSPAESAPVAPKQETHAAESAPVESDGAAAPSEAREQPNIVSPPSSQAAESRPDIVEDKEKSVMPAATAPQPDARATQANAANASTPKFTVQIGSHSNESSANEQISRLRAAGSEARTVVVELPGRGKWYRVQVGSFDDRASAQKEAAALRAKGVAPAAIVVPQQ